ncbi:MAG TPA: hypothetical protein VGH08_09125 [Chthoniobacterales bacterium]|jgi:hypothetical protein
MNESRAVYYSALLVTFFIVAACSTSDSVMSREASSGRYYAVGVEETPFYHYGPQQGNGPDKKLTRNTLLTVIAPSFGYSRVQLMNGEQGYLASEDIHLASAALVAAATAPPPGNATSRVQRFRLNSGDPRLITPPEPLPLDLPEPTPIPETQSSPH